MVIYPSHSPCIYPLIHLSHPSYINPSIPPSSTYYRFQPAAQPGIKGSDLQRSGEDRLKRQRHGHHDPLCYNGSYDDDEYDHDNDDSGDDDDDKSPLSSYSLLQYVPKKLGLLGSGFLEVAVVAL